MYLPAHARPAGAAARPTHAPPGPPARPALGRWGRPPAGATELAASRRVAESGGERRDRYRACLAGAPPQAPRPGRRARSEEHTSELQSQFHLVCRLLLEKKKD